MSLLISLRSELLKTKRSPSWLLTFIMASLAPILVVVAFGGDTQVKRVIQDPWNFYFYQGRGIMSIVFLPMFVVMISTLLPQIEYRNHTWKQVLSSPQSFGRLYLSKFLVFQSFILTFIVAHTVFMLIACVVSNAVFPKFNFFAHQLDWLRYGKMALETYVTILALSTLQFWLGLRFRSFLLPIGVGVLFSILGMINIEYKIIDLYLYFFDFSAYIIIKDNELVIPSVMWISCAYAAVFLVLGFIDFRLRKAE